MSFAYNEPVQTLTLPSDARVFFVGDIHGQYDILMRGIRDAGISWEKGDILISLGDMIDSGPHSEAVLEFFTQPNTFAIRGNHEEFLLEVFERLDPLSFHQYQSYWHQKGKAYVLSGNTAPLFRDLPISLVDWLINGGDWAMDTTYDQLGKLADHILRLPHLLDIKHGARRYAAVHAGLGKASLKKAAHLPNLTLQRKWLWDRSAYKSWEKRPDGKHAKQAHRIVDVDMLLVGHTTTPSRRPLIVENTVYLDTGAKYGDPLHIMEANALLRQIDRTNMVVL